MIMIFKLLLDFSLDTSECDRVLNYTLPIIANKDQGLCHVSSSCDRLTCCVYIAPIKRHAQVALVLNTCSYGMEAEIDNLRITRNLFSYKWGIL